MQNCQRLVCSSFRIWICSFFPGWCRGNKSLCSDQTTAAQTCQETLKIQGQWSKWDRVVRVARHKAQREESFTCPRRLWRGLRHFSHEQRASHHQQSLQRHVALSVRFLSSSNVFPFGYYISLSQWRPFAFLVFSPWSLGKVISSFPTSTSSRDGHPVYTQLMRAHSLQKNNWLGIWLHLPSSQKELIPPRGILLEIARKSCSFDLDTTSLTPSALLQVCTRR